MGTDPPAYTEKARETVEEDLVASEGLPVNWAILIRTGSSSKRTPASPTIYMLSLFQADTNLLGGLLDSENSSGGGCPPTLLPPNVRSKREAEQQGLQRENRCLLLIS